ncbi:MAG: HEAT repeat domain-containing protein [Gemmataceae bacterium]
MLDAPQIRKLIKALSADDENIRWEALRSVKQSEGQDWAALPADVVHPLVKALQDQLQRKNAVNGKGRLPTFRQEVVLLLGNLGPRAETAVPQLIDLLEDGESQAVREAAVTALGKIGADARAASEKLVRMLGPGVRDTLAARIARALGDIGRCDAKVQSALVSLWLTPGMSESCKEQIALALCKLDIDAPGLRACLIKALLTNAHLSSRKIATEALGCCDKGAIGVLPALIVALHDADEEVKRLATAALDRMKLSPKKAIERCGDQLDECMHAEVALRKSGAEAVPTLIAALSHKKPTVREKAAQVLGSLGELAVAAGPALDKALKDKTPEVRLCAAKALWNITKQADTAVPVLADLLKQKPAPSEDPEAGRRFLQSVIEALGRIGPPARATIPALMKQSRNDNRLIRESAQRTIRQIDPTAMPA